MPGKGDDTISRKLSVVLNQGVIRISLDLVAAARRHLSFLRKIADSPWLHDAFTVLQAVRRYDEFWMPLISDISKGASKSSMLVPPIDVQWVWHCHCLNPASYRRYCESKFMKIREKPALFDDENEDYAEIRCREVWRQRYPSEPFDLEPIEEDPSTSPKLSDKNGILTAVLKHQALYTKFWEPYLSEVVYLIAAKHRYKGFLYMLQEHGDGSSRFVPTSDILLMWLTHQSFPATYASDVKDMEANLEKIVGIWEAAKAEDFRVTKKLWETTFDQPYEKAGATFDENLSKRSPIFWGVFEADVNRKYKTLEPRFLLEACVFLKGKWDEKVVREAKKTFLRLRTVRCHRDLKMNKGISDVPPDSWQKAWHLYCEFGTRGIALELRQQGGGCLRSSKLKKVILFPWNDLSRATSLTMQLEMESHMRAVASITPPVQAPYLLKCVPDRVTDDSGAMISDVILRMNQYRPQEGRWLSRTVLDHAGRECFVIRIRIGGGFWRRGAETPAAVKWEERIIEVREGAWAYVAGSIGKAPEKVVGTARPKEEVNRDEKATWCLSTGDVLTIRRDESGLSFDLENENNDGDSEVRLVRGRRLRYQGDEVGSKSSENEDEEGFLTLVRYTAEKPKGNATALLNWRLFVVEFSPEEDAVMILLICMAIVRSVSEFQRQDLGRLLVRRRERETETGRRDWGSVVLHPSVSASSLHFQPWYWNAKEVFALPEYHYARPQTYNYSPADGGDGLYKRVITQRI
ncbi:glycine-rich domain-containing protein 1 [Aristolochia californica]|uniref:glycine-rich domain-containing protein 1 n=1 Tax=Aristolochia californica TaxID=171875 RepID=UPI0035D69508